MGGGMSSITSRTSKKSFEILKEDPSIFSNYPEVQATCNISYKCIIPYYEVILYKH
jgi:hypothetical protein